MGARGGQLDVSSFPPVGRIANSNNMNKSESDQEDNDDINDNDWSYGSEKKGVRGSGETWGRAGGGGQVGIGSVVVASFYLKRGEESVALYFSEGVLRPRTESDPVLCPFCPPQPRRENQTR